MLSRHMLRCRCWSSSLFVVELFVGGGCFASLSDDRQTDTCVLCSMYTYVLVEKKSLLILTKKNFLDDGR